MKIFPAIDLKNNKCVRLTQGMERSAKIYNENPFEQAKFFEEQGCERIHVVDLDAAFGRPEVNKETIINIKKSIRTPIQLGGGIRSKDDVNFWLEKNIDYLIIGSMAVTNIDLVKKIAEEFENKIYIAMDVISKNTAEDEIMIKGWTEGSKLSSLDISRMYKESKIKGYILTSINHDGMMQGPSKGFYNKIDFYQKPLIFSGGYSSYLELELLSYLYFSKKDFINRNGGVEGVIIGKAFYSGTLEVKKAIRALNKHAQN